MKIVICGSLKAEKEILKMQKKLQEKGHSVEIPLGIKLKLYGGKKQEEVPDSEKVEIKIKHDVIRQYYNEIKKSDVVLIVNPELNGIKGYIGGNTLMEMGFAHVLNKPIYCLYQIPEVSYKPEIIAMQPVILNGSLDKLLRGLDSNQD